MADPKRFIVLGLGTFGGALATKLHQNGCRVTGVDSERERVEALKDFLYEPVIADVTDREALEHLGVKNALAVFIGLGEEMVRSLLAALHCKELGARRIIVKGLSAEHGKMLKYLGVERVVFPEIEMAQDLADRVTWPNVLDYLPIDPEYSFVELAVPDSMAGKTLREVELRRQYRIWVIGIKDVLSGKLEMFPDAEHKLINDQLLLVVGKQTDLNRLREVS